MLTRISVLTAALAVSLTGLTPAVASQVSSGNSNSGWRTTQVSTGPRALDRVDVYAPTDAGQRPALLYLHGGGWKISKTQAYWVKRFKAIARDQGWVVGVAYYPTTAPGHRSIRSVEQDAVKADLDALSSQPDVDPGKVAIWGQSAGGQLGALIAYQNPAEVAAIVSSSGPANMATENDSIVKSDVHYYEGESYAKSVRRHDHRYQSTSPTSYISPVAPPTYAFIDKGDPFVPSKQYKQYRRKLKQAGVEHRVLILPGATHTPEDTEVPGDRQTVEQEGVDFITRVEQ